MSKYLGRVVGIGKLPGDRPFIAYAVSGRSDPSKDRKARIIEDKNLKRVNIGPLDPDNLTEKQKEQAQWIYYNGIIIPKNTIGKEDVCALASNGEQTDAIYKLLTDRELSPMYGSEAMRAAMITLGPEREKYKTPRVAGFLDSFVGFLGIVTEDGVFDGECMDINSDDAKDMAYVSTYAGKEGSNDVVVPNGKVEIPMGRLDLHGKTAQELADNLYDWIPKDLVVCTAVALSDPDYNFELAVRNLHE